MNTEDKTDHGGYGRVVPLQAGLYLVATPIGALRDMTLRGLDVLRSAAMVFCEDTRVTRKLLNAYNIKAKVYIYNDHSDAGQRQRVMDAVAAGEAVALVSDAGMPLVSDPGYKLVQEMRAAGLPVYTAPGANAPLSALQLSGMPNDCFSFLGFLPSKAKAKRDALRVWADVPTTLVFFEAAPRIVDTLNALDEMWGATRRVSVVREITKLYEQTRTDTPAALSALYTAEGLPRGEIVVVVEPPAAKSFSEADIEDMIRTALDSMKTKQAAAFVAAETGVKTTDLYDIALRINKERRGA